jgi:REP element-mobilizing transposase RayT
VFDQAEPETAIWRSPITSATLCFMPRRPRVDAAGAIQHVIARGNAGVRIVADDEDRRELVAGLARAADRYSWRVHAYCLMDTHFHAVVETPEPTLGAGMQRLLGGYAAEFNRRHGRYGHLFGGPYSASRIETEAYAIEVCAYVVLNPVRAGLVVDPADWKWSSYRASAGLVHEPSFLETELLPAMLHSDRMRAQALYRELIRDAAERPRPGSG